MNHLSEHFRRLAFALLLAPALVLTGCDDDPTPAPENEEESIPGVTVAFTSETADPVTLTYLDANGDGEVQDDELTVDGSFVVNETYDYQVTFLNEAGEPFTELQQEVAEEEGDEHRFFIFPTNAVLFDAVSLNVTFDGLSSILPADDLDENGCTIGLAGSFRTADGAGGSTDIRVKLAHQPDTKECSTNPQGNPNAGDTDIDLVFESVSVLAN